MTKQDIAILIQTMEAPRKTGGFSFDVMPMVASTNQRLTDLFNLMGPESKLVIDAKKETQPAESKVNSVK
jgi:hypothetical protein